MSSSLHQLGRLIRDYDSNSTGKKLQLLHRLKSQGNDNARHIIELHEHLLYLRAYPDSPEILDLVNYMLKEFSSRNDLKMHRDELVNSGISGTDIEYNFFSPMARWLTKKWPDHFTIDWDDSDHSERLMDLLPLLLTFPEMSQIEDFDLTPQQWLALLKGPGETDATFLKRRLDRINKSNIYAQESLHDRLDLAFRLTPGITTPSITDLYYQTGPVHFQSRPFNKNRPVLRRVIRDLSFTTRYMSRAEGERLADLGRATMVTHDRDLDAFSYGDSNDVRLINAGDGNQMICIGTIPGHRYLLPVIYGFINLKNGVPIGYFQVSVSYDIADIAFTTFSTFRGTEAATVLSKNLAVAQQMFDINTFTFDSYQLGHGNKDGLQSGVWWFYYKLGFRPRDAYIKDLVKKELKKMKSRKSYRSSLDILDELSSENLYLQLNPNLQHNDLLEQLSKLGPGISTYLARHYGHRREEGLKDCVTKANKLLGVHKNHKFTRDENHMWQSWAPIVLQLPGIQRWSTKNKRDMVAAIRAKGGRRESDFIKLFNKHKLMQSTILKFAQSVEI
jgi:hypothetical protein